jgi:hypothetical protein
MASEKDLKTINFTSARSKQTFPLIMTGSFTIIGVLIVVFTDLYFLGGAIAFGGGYGFYSISKATNSPNAMLRIDKFGIRVNNTELKIDLRWKEIEECRSSKIVGHDHIFIYIKNPKEKLSTMDFSTLKKKLHLKNIKTYDTFIFFSTSLLDMDAIDILKLMERYRKTANKIEACRDEID